ncbi:hypothetical protein WR25_13255 [Diploscapter pachys]|uniref:WAP domain-containing protein n=1 Tax=Diploscapter pachys TaxID=2018661 RepID=A0A2A2LWP2_9BILA|nr:hypothetical protein WR25_13255 [Diploscapter pachys]
MCTFPCRWPFIDTTRCRSICQNSTNLTACDESCEYLREIYDEKPGNCPRIENLSNYECSALCTRDGDCADTEKCCTYGCSRKCVKPNNSKIPLEANLLPLPRNIAINERKRKRSIIIKWDVGKMTKQQLSSSAHIFLIQWRWGLSKDEKLMTEWQTVAVKTKPSAILKHLLSPGRYYQFRIAAVSVFGSLGYSKPSDPFKISKEPKAPSIPRELSLGSSRLTPVGLWNQVVQWVPPLSDLPIKNYEVSWARINKKEVEALDRLIKGHQDKRSLDDHDGVAHNFTAKDRNSALLPGHLTHIEISGLIPESAYIVEIHASVDSSEGELHGENGIITIQTLPLNPEKMAQDRLIPIPTSTQLPNSVIHTTTAQIDLIEPYYHSRIPFHNERESFQAENDVDEEFMEVFPGGEIVELPLESSYDFKNTVNLPVLIFSSLFAIIFMGLLEP